MQFKLQLSIEESLYLVTLIGDNPYAVLKSLANTKQYELCAAFEQVLTVYEKVKMAVYIKQKEFSGKVTIGQTAAIQSFLLSPNVESVPPCRSILEQTDKIMNSIPPIPTPVGALLLK